MSAPKWAREHRHLNLPWLVPLLSRLGKLLCSLLEILGHLLLRIWKPPVWLEVGHSLLHIVKTLVARTHRILVGLESSSVGVLPLIISCSGLQKIQLLQLDFQVLNKEIDLTHYHCCLFQGVDSD